MKNIIKVYHGSDHIIKHPNYMGGKDDNDYGNGFYTTEYQDRAESWAALNGNAEKSFVNVYELDMDSLEIMNLRDYGVLSWIAEVVAHRGTSQEQASIIGERIVHLYQQDTRNTDIVIGYRADDSYTQVVEAFLLNQLNIAEVERMFYKGSLGNQVFLKSEKAFRHIKWLDAYEVPDSHNYMQYDQKARQEVNRFLNSRMRSLLLEEYQVTGITARTAINNKLIYHKDGDYYETASL